MSGEAESATDPVVERDTTLVDSPIVLEQSELSADELKKDLRGESIAEALADPELDALEQEYDSCVEAFDLELAPKKIQGAAMLVKEFFGGRHAPTGTVSISLEDGEINEILVIDTASLKELEARVAGSLEKEINTALVKAADDADEVRATQVGGFTPAGSFDPAR